MRHISPRRFAEGVIAEGTFVGIYNAFGDEKNSFTLRAIELLGLFRDRVAGFVRGGPAVGTPGRFQLPGFEPELV